MFPRVKMWLAAMVAYFADFFMAAASEALPASNEVLLMYVAARVSTTVTSYVSIDLTATGLVTSFIHSFIHSAVPWDESCPPPSDLGLGLRVRVSSGLICF